MNRMLGIILALTFVFSGNVFAQVIADFEVDENGFYDNGWGPGLNSVAQTDDPSGLSDGALSLDYNGTGKGVIQLDNVDPLGAQIITYYVYLTTDVPDSISFKLWAQDNGTWSWTEVVYYAYQIPREVWYPINYNMEAMRVDPDISFDHITNKIGKMGVEVANWDEHDADTSWGGPIYIDNVSLVGAEPTVFADFEVDESGFYDNGWGPGLNSVAQTSGALAIEYNSTGKGVIQIDNLDAAGNDIITYFVYLPADIPDSISFKLWAQDAGTWSWTEVVYYVYDMPKEVWYPLVYDMEAMRVDPDISFDHITNKIGKMGIEIANWDEHDSDTSWVGTIQVDNASFLSPETGVKWVLADFENEAAGTQSFANNGWGAGLTNVAWAADPTTTSAGVLNTDWDFNFSGVKKGSFEHGNINLGWAEGDTGATEITVDVWLPAEIPQQASQLSIFYRDHSTWTWNEDKFSISDSTVKPGEWNTINFEVKAKVLGGTIDPFAGGSLGLQLYYSDTTVTWAGSIHFDNVTLIGAEEPEGETESPTVAAVVDTSENTVPQYENVELTWVDSGPGTETYNVYMSESPITDLAAPGVIRLTNDIPHGEQRWPHRPWSNDGSDKTYYYAVTANKADGTETEPGLTDPVTLSTSVTAKAKFDADFATKFTLDGLNTEFVEHAAYKLEPENASGTESDGWTKESTDMSWSITFVVDEDYLYISADVTDDDLNAEGNNPIFAGTQPWMGDALEIFMGYYDVNTLPDYHNYKDVDAAGTGDWRIAYTAWGTTGTATSNNTEFPGIETTVFAKFTGDGYIIEARVALDSLAMDNDIEVLNGTLLPMSINGNDLDPQNGDEGRTLQANWGGGGGHESWKRPGSWGFLEVVDGPTAIDEEVIGIKTFELYNNYPNPFNPITTIKFQLPKKSDLSVVVYDILGNKVRTLEKGTRNAGVHTIQWDGKNNKNEKVSSGIYFYTLKTSEFNRTHKMILLK